MSNNTETTKPIEERVDRILIGAIDPHVHSGPSIAARAVRRMECHSHHACVECSTPVGYTNVGWCTRGSAATGR